MKKEFIKPTISMEAFGFENIIQSSGVTPEKSNEEKARLSFGDDVNKVTVISIF